MTGPLLATASNGTSSLTPSWQLPAISPGGDNVRLVAWVQLRPNRTLNVPAGWTLRAYVDDSVDVAPGQIRYALIDRLVTTDAAPYADVVTSAGGSCYWSAAQEAFRSSGGATPQAGTANATYDAPTGLTGDQTLAADLPDPATAGRVLIAYVTRTSGAHSGAGRTWQWPVGWTVVEAVPGQSSFIGGAEVAYKVAAGGETGVTVTDVGDGVTEISSLSVIVAEYEIDVTPTIEPAGWDVYAAADPNGALLATLTSARDRKIRPELNGTGIGSFAISRFAPEATEAILAQGNLVKVRIPALGADYVFAFFLEEGDFDLLSTDEEGGELLTFGGRGSLAYLDRAVMWSEAFTTGLDTSDTWTQVWESSGVLHPSGTWYDASEGRLNVIDQVTRCRYQIDQTTQVATVVSSPLFPKPALGLSGDPDDPTVYWTLEGDWPSGGSSHTKIHRHDKDTDAILDTFDLGSAIKLSAIKVSGTAIWATRYDGTTTVHSFSKVDGSQLSADSISYGGVTQLKATGVSVLGTELLLWFEGTARALRVDEGDLSTILGVITAADLPSLGADWTDEGGNQFLYPDSVTLGKTWKFQITSAAPHDPRDGVWRLDEATPGAIAARLLAEYQAAGRPQHPIPDLTYVFDSVTDSDGNPWATNDGTLEFTAQVGDPGLDPFLRLIPYGLKLQMSPYLALGAYNTFGTDRSSATFATGKVRLEAGVNIVEGLQRKRSSRRVGSHMLAQGDGGLYATATQADLGYVQEDFISTQLKDATALAGTAAATLARERQVAESISVVVPWGNDEAAGRYLPFVHYGLGDVVRLHTGSGEWDYDEVDATVFGITIAERENGEWLAIVDLADGDPDTVGGTGSASGGGQSGGGSGAPGGAPASSALSLVVEQVDATGALVTSVTGGTIRSADLGFWEEEPGVIRVSVPATHIAVAETSGMPAIAAVDTIHVPAGGLTEDGEAVALLEYAQRRHGGQDTVKAHGNLGATETFDPADGNVHTGTLNADCTVTLAQPAASGAATIEAWFAQDGTGGWALTVVCAGGGAFSWNGGTPTLPTIAATVFRVIFEHVPGTTNDWVGDLVGGASFATPAIVLGTAAADGVAATAVRSDATIVAFDATAPVTQAFGDTAASGSAPVAARRDHVHGMPAAPTSSAPSHVHVAQEQHTSDGAAVLFTLDNDFEPESVIARNQTTGAWLGVTETLPNQATVSAAGSAGDVIAFAYAATTI